VRPFSLQAQTPVNALFKHYSFQKTGIFKKACYITEISTLRVVITKKHLHTEPTFFQARGLI
jgi:hypothetical protein